MSAYLINSPVANKDAQMIDISAPLRRPLSDHDRAVIRYMAEDNRPRIEIAGAVGRCVGTVKTEIRRIRAAVIDPIAGVSSRQPALKPPGVTCAGLVVSSNFPASVSGFSTLAPGIFGEQLIGCVLNGGFII